MKYLLTVFSFYGMFHVGPKEPGLPSAVNEFLPPGLLVINDFVTADEEHQLLAALDWRNSETG